MATAAQLPVRAAPAPSCVGLSYIAARAGLTRKSLNYQLNYVRLCVANESFPPPLPQYNVSRGVKVSAITHGSRWLRDAVDAWFDGFLPPQLASVVEDGRLAADGALLDSRAAALAAA